MYNIFWAQALSRDMLRLQDNIREGVSPCSVFGVSDAIKPHLSAFAAQNRPVLYICSSAERARDAAADIETYMGTETVVIPPAEAVFGVQSSGGLSRERICALKRIRDGAGLIFADLSALMYPVLSKTVFDAFCRTVRVSDTIPPSGLIRFLLEAGYASRESAEGAGQFCARGGIIDIFPVGFDNPVRIEFFDDEVDSVRMIDASTQRSVRKLDKVELLPARMLCFNSVEAKRGGAALKSAIAAQEKRLSGISQEALNRLRASFCSTADALEAGDVCADETLSVFFRVSAPFTDYLPENTVIVLDEPRRLRERGENCMLEFAESFKAALEKGTALPPQGRLIYTYDELFSSVSQHTLLALQGITSTSKDISPKAVFTFTGRNMQSFQNKVSLLAQEMIAMKGKKYTVLICAGSRSKARALQNELANCSVHVNYTEDYTQKPVPECAYVLPASITRGFEYPEQHFAIISDRDIFTAATVRKRRHSRIKGGAPIDSFSELAPGDFVVHENNGIGIYRGMEKITVDGIPHDYICIAYQGTDKLFVPVEQLNLVQKFIGAAEGTTPKLSKLGSREWQATKAKVRKSIEDITDRLAELYRKRENARGHAFSADTPWQRQFEEDFPYEETPDQLACINEIKADMEKDRVMDRLLCGDVGYGKTEVALRAAFKAVMDGMQVAILAPTTILAQQHYNTVVNRTLPFGVRCEVLSRFRTGQECQEIKKRLADGKIDIIVGTHALLAKSVVFKNLGLLIVDEEQRFGVKHKERIKEIKSNIDVLTLTATPIPRTLHMSLLGVRDMSVLETPPQERYPVQTYVTEYDTTLIRDAIGRELARGGQVYFVFNRVQGIETFAASLQSLVPKARIAVGHGQMEEGALEQVMLDFYNGLYDILLCTTIIESGLDVPNVNTMVVYDADNFGLSQLYQLRGRVGRSNRLAYAYLTFRREKVMTEAAEKRLNALREFTEFGSGFKIAMRDLEIRGAGNLLGSEQSGHMEKVGYDLYCKLVKEEVARRKGDEEIQPEVSAELRIAAYIDSSYIANEVQKLNVYKRITGITNESERDDLIAELTDRFGAPPPAVKMLCGVAYLRALAATAGIDRIRQTQTAVLFSFAVGFQPDFAHISEVLSGFGGRAALSAGNAVALCLNTANLSDAAILELSCRLLVKINE